jgi:hypothetical protein
MLWWLIGAWVASGILIPVLWLLSGAGRSVVVRSSNGKQATGALTPPPDNMRATSNRRHMGRYLLYGLSVVGAVILLLIGSFRDPITAMRNLDSAFADAEAPMSQQAGTSSPIQVEIAVNPTVRDEEENGWDDLARRADVVAVQRLPAWRVKAMSASATPAYPDRSVKRVEHQGRHGRVVAYVAQSRRGTWLFPPNANAGGNN